MTTITHFHLFCGIGGGALGFQQASPRIPGLRAEYRCLGGIDVDPAAVRDFTSLTGVDGTVLDLFDADQYTAWHGSPPPADWQEVTPDDIRRAANNERPNVVFTSPPCKGFSGLLPEKSSKTAKYQAMNRLALRGVWLALEAWADDPPDFFILENVPRIATRGRHLLDQIGGLLRQYGYSVAETVHDCGELGGLAQSRKRFLLVARHREKIPPYLHVPQVQALRSVGSVLEALPVPVGSQANPMHRLPNLSWRTWVRLALIPPGGDWRDLLDLRVEGGVLADYVISATPRDDHLGVHSFGESMGTVTGRSGATNGAFSIADPRVFAGKSHYMTGGHFGVKPWDGVSMAVSGSACQDNGWWTIADPRVPMSGEYGQYGILRWERPTGAVSSQSAPGGGRYSVADPRQATIMKPLTIDGQAVPHPDTKGVFMIQALHGGAWHRPFTTLELAALQGFVDLDGPLDGQSDTRWRMAIGNAVPPPAARAIADVIGRTILLAWAGETFVLGSTPVWVQPLVAAVSGKNELEEIAL
ncbi:MAG: DNA cytosine methyltransferase [Magnetococcales bacterium]|nr:DNA cytosine methyltransferase [Magnetococcales bacterium]